MRKITFLLLTLLMLAGFSAHAAPSSNDPFADQPFVVWYTDMAGQIKTHPGYQRIPLDTKEQAGEFIGWLHDLYREQITPEQFESKLDARYPGHDNEARFILSLLPPPNQRPER